MTTGYPQNGPRAASAARYPARVAGPRRIARRAVRTLIGPLLGPVQRARQTQLAALPLEPGRWVFAGDSITEGGAWSEWLPDFPVINRGVSGETSGELLQRLDAMLDRPAAVVLLIGTNDIAQAVPTGRIVANVRRILDRIEEVAPGTPIVVQSIMPRAVKYREEVRYLNRHLRSLAPTGSANRRYLDLWPALATPEGALRPEFTEDKLHLNGGGYRAWVSAIRPVMEEIRGARGL